MDIRSALMHMGFCVGVGALIAALTPARWLAASLWVSSSLLLNGALAVLEDSRPGEIDNLDGMEPTQAALVLAGKVAALDAVFAGLGFAVQFLWLAKP